MDERLDNIWDSIFRKKLNRTDHFDEDLELSYLVSRYVTAKVDQLSIGFARGSIGSDILPDEIGIIPTGKMVEKEFLNQKISEGYHLFHSNAQVSGVRFNAEYFDILSLIKHDGEREYLELKHLNDNEVLIVCNDKTLWTGDRTAKELRGTFRELLNDGYEEYEDMLINDIVYGEILDEIKKEFRCYRSK